MQNSNKECGQWPRDFFAGDPAIWIRTGERVRILKENPDKVPKGFVPVEFEKPAECRGCIDNQLNIPADDLDRI